MTDFASFHDVRFPTDVAFGATGGPERRNEIVQMTSGRERRNTRFSQSRRHYDAGTGLRSLDDLHDVLAFFEARRGSLHGFRFRDPLDWKSCRPNETPTALDQAIGIGDGTTRRFALVKTYGEGDDAYARLIAKPVAGTLIVAVDGVAQASPDDFAFDDVTGEIVFTVGATPGEDALVTAGYEFDVPVRFDTERIAVSISSFRAGQIPSIPLVEVQP
jgi:uncharacterized protein (TIGR02217 family)